MYSTTIGRPSEPAVSPEVQQDIATRAEEALRRATQWSDWMQAAEKARQDHEDSVQQATAEPDEGWIM